jgi:CheY-like chemotaxis protein
MSSPTSQRTALLAVMDPVQAGLCRRELEDVGFTVEAVESGIAAVTAARRMLLHLVLMDFQLRDVSSREAVGWLRTNPAVRATPVVILTDGAEEETALSAIQASTTLRRPASAAAIRRAIRDALRTTPRSRQ